MNQKHYKEEILRKAESIIRQQGYNKTGINEILKTCQIPKGSFYNFFKNKEAFGLELLDYYGNNTRKFIEAILKNTACSPIQRLQLFFEESIRMHTQECFQKGCLLNNFSVEMAGLHETFAQKIHENDQNWISLFRQCIKEGQERNEIIQTYTAQELAEYIHINFSGALAKMKTMRNAQPLELCYKMAIDFLTKN